VRDFALKQPYDVTGNYPGKRTRTLLTQGGKDALQTVLWNAAGKITDWHEKDGLTGSFQLTTAKDRSWIHTDHHNTWAGVLYLTPDAPLSGGTGLFRYQANKARYAHEITSPYEAQDMTKWEQVDRIGNIYNRMILYRSNMFHTSLDYFGSGPDDGRLFQLFFLTTQY
jgi:hypothetical protein